LNLQDAHFLFINSLSEHCPCFYILQCRFIVSDACFFFSTFLQPLLLYLSWAQTFYQVLSTETCLSVVLFSAGFLSICEVVECCLTMWDWKYLRSMLGAETYITTSCIVIRLVHIHMQSLPHDLVMTLGNTVNFWCVIWSTYCALNLKYWMH
jgi:hypothetical protein